MQCQKTYSSSQSVLLEKDLNRSISYSQSTVIGTSSSMYAPKETQVTVQQYTQEILYEAQLECPATAKKLWSIRKSNVLQNISTADPIVLQKLLKENIDKYLHFAAKYHIISDFATGFSNDVQEKSLHELKSKYFNEQTGLHSDFPFPFTEDLETFFTGQSSMNDHTSETFLQNEYANFNSKIDSQMEMAAVNRNEMLRILLEQKAEKRDLNGKAPLDAYVVDANELPCFMDKLFQNLPPEKHRMQLMVRSDAHYTAVEIELSPEGHRCLVLDAALDRRYMAIPQMLKNYPFKDIYVSGNEVKIQYDFINCATFALTQLTSSSKMEDLFDRLEQLNYNDTLQEGVKFIEWNQFPAIFLKNSQTISLLQKHPEWTENFKHGLNLSEFIMIQAGERNGRPANFRIEKKFEKYANATREACQKIGTAASVAIGCMNSLEKLARRQKAWPV